MTIFEYLRSMNEDQFAEWLDEHGQFDNSPWMAWFDYKYLLGCGLKVRYRRFTNADLLEGDED